MTLLRLLTANSLGARGVRTRHPSRPIIGTVSNMARTKELRSKELTGSNKKRRKVAERQPEELEDTQVEEDVPHAAAQPAAAADMTAEPTGWEELDQPQDVQQEAGGICKLRQVQCQAFVPGRRPPCRACICRRHPARVHAAACQASAPSLPHASTCWCLPAESKHAKKRAKEERERQIREAELRRLQVGASRAAATAPGQPPRGLPRCMHAVLVALMGSSCRQ